MAWPEFVSLVNPLATYMLANLPPWKSRLDKGHSDNAKYLEPLRNSTTFNLNTGFDAYLTLRLLVIVGRMVG
jgi:hypothetical protein